MVRWPAIPLNMNWPLPQLRENLVRRCKSGGFVAGMEYRSISHESTWKYTDNLSYWKECISFYLLINLNISNQLLDLQAADACQKTGDDQCTLRANEIHLGIPKFQ